jgi:hypothetical protein
VRERIVRQRRRRIATVAAAGYHIVAQVSGPTDNPPWANWTPTTLDAEFFITCSIREQGWTAAAYVGISLVSGVYDCPTGSPTAVGISIDQTGLAAGVRVGVPTMVDLKLTHFPVVVTNAVPPAGVVSLGIGEAASFDDYPLPPRPATLPPLVRPTGLNAPLALFGPFTPAAAPVPASGTVAVDIRAQTPGFITISVAGGPSRTVKIWVYGTDQLISLDVGHPSGPAMVTVTEQHMTGDWFVAIRSEG